jgi:putative DNA primase/helicase
MTIEIDEFIERRILTGLIISKEYLDWAKPVLKLELIEADGIRRVASWCFDHYEKYQRAPDKDIELIFLSKMKTDSIRKEDGQFIENILTGISERYGSGEEFDANYLKDQTKEYVLKRELQEHSDTISILLKNGRIDEARELSLNYQAPVFDLDGPTSRWIHGAKDKTAKAVPWVWKDVIARRQISLMFGRTGHGKTLFTSAIIAILTTGGTWPTAARQAWKTDVVIVSEDPWEEVVLPRLLAAKADIDRCHYLRRDGEGKFLTRINTVDNLIKEIERCLDELPRKGLRSVVVIETVVSFLDGKESNSDTVIRPALEKIQNMARRRDVAVILHHHPTKSSIGDALLTVRGSGAYVEVPRLVHLVVTDPADEGRHLLLFGKSNLGGAHKGFSGRKTVELIRSGGTDINTAYVIWESATVGLTADQWRAQQHKEPKSSKLNEVRDWLKETLGDGPMLPARIKELAREQGYSWRTIEAAKSELGIKSEKTGFNGAWQWSL